jgi:hypothetical protein
LVWSAHRGALQAICRHLGRARRLISGEPRQPQRKLVMMLNKRLSDSFWLNANIAE